MDPMFEMTGTEGSSSQYIVIAHSDIGKIGFRDISNNSYRVRLVPNDEKTAEALSSVLTGWTQPTFEHLRFSRVINGQDELESCLKEGVSAIKANNMVYNPEAPAWAAKLRPKPIKPERDEKQMLAEASGKLFGQIKKQLR